MSGFDRTLAAGPSSLDVTQAVEGAGPPARGSDTALQRGSGIGRYVVLTLLGSGGMGVVYAAYDPELDRKVAIKLLHTTGTGGEDTRGAPRLLREAQAMARLSHPNVIAVHDVGTHDGQVFLAMEFVEGHTLGDELAARPRGWREVVQLYAAAGRGLAAAHRSKLVHRDFKPDNVMVDRDGRVRVLDFGLACAADTEVARVDVESTSSLDVRLTATGAVMGTPAYMAPEQHLGMPADERSDQFAFCVALYEALYGERPFVGDTMAALVLSVIQGEVREPKPGSRVPGQLRRALLRGLAQAPEQRHPDMPTLLAELERDPSRRRRWALGGVLAALLLAGGGLGVNHMLGARAQLCSGSEDQLAGVWDDERRAAGAAAFALVDRPFAREAWADVDARLGEYTRAWVAMRAEACAATRIRGEQSEELLDRRMSCLQRQLDRVRSVVDGLVTADLAVVEHAVEVVAGLPDPSMCADLEALMSPVERPADAETAAKVAALRQRQDEAYVLHQLGKVQLAADHTQKIVDDARALGFRPQLAEVLVNHGEMQHGLGAIKDAEAIFEEALRLAEASHHDVFAARALIWLVVNLSAGQNRFAEAHRFARIAQAAIDRLGGDDELQAELDGRRALAYHLEGEREKAMQYSSSAVALAERLYGPDDLRMVDILKHQATIERARDHHAEAEQLYRRILRILQTNLGEQHPRIGGVLTNLSLMHMELGRPKEAEKTLREALALYDASLPPDHPELGITLNALAQQLNRDDRNAEAEQLGLRALAIFTAKFGARHRNVVVAHVTVANAQVSQKHFEDALTHLRAAHAGSVEIYGAEHALVAKVARQLGDLFWAMKDYPSALTEYRRSIAVLERVDPDGSALSDSLTGEGMSLVELGQGKAAIGPLERALALAAHDITYTPGNIGVIRFALARALWEEPRERPRALAEGRLARDAAAVSNTGHSHYLDEVTTWLAAREGREK